MSSAIETWAPPAQPVGSVRLQLDGPIAPDADPVSHDVSAAVRIGDTLFLAADECAHIEVLERRADGLWAGHRRIVLSDFFDLPDPDEEMDIEGLSLDDDWLWIVGSHSRTRRKPKKSRPVDAAAIERMAELKANPNRAFLGRLPLAPMGAEDGPWGVAGVDAPKRKGRRPGMLSMGKHGSALARVLEDDPHLGPFTRIPAKENGLDVEGVAVAGDRVAVGLRGPVINTWGMVLEFRIRETKHGELKLDGEVIKRWLDLDGLGVRDLKRDGDDLLILAGPSMALDGPTAIHRWRGWATQDPSEAPLQLAPERLFDLPYGRSCDHPEALALMGDDTLLVVCDSPAKTRLGSEGLTADLFRL